MAERIYLVFEIMAVSVIQLTRYFPSLIWHSDAVDCVRYMIHIPLFLFLLFLYKKKILNKIALYMQQNLIASNSRQLKMTRR